jgi:hypothetical protein
MKIAYRLPKVSGGFVSVGPKIAGTPQHEVWGEVPCAFVVTKPENNLSREQIFSMYITTSQT